MDTATLSTNFQIEIPHAVREQLGLTRGQRFYFVAFGDCIQMVPIKPMKAMRGFLKELSNTFAREKERHLRF